MVGLAQRASSIGVALAVSSFVMSARAERAKVHVDWPAVPSCPDAKSVIALARRAMASADAVDTVLARVKIDPPAASGEPWRVRIRTRTVRGAGERTLEADTCAELARASALLVALAAMRTTTPVSSDEIAELMPAADRTPEPDVLPLARPLGLPRRAPREASDEEANARFIVSAGAWAGAGLLPSLAWGPSAAASYERALWSARLTVHAALPQERVLGSLGATFDALGAGVDLCRVLPLVRLATFSTHACAGVDLDAIRARGKGAESEDAVRAEALAFLGLGAAWSPAPRIRVGLDVRAGPSLLRPTFAVVSASASKQTLHEPAVVRVEGTLACGVVF